VTADEILPTGDVEIVLEYEQKPFRPFAETTGGTAKLSVNGKVVGNGEIPNVVIGRFSATETLDIGMDLGAVASPAYHDREPFAFTGNIKEVTIEVSPTQPLIKK
jgi:arylsulfatase